MNIHSLKKDTTKEWYKKELEENKREIIKGALISLAVTAAFSLWYFITGESFTLKEYRFISEPTLAPRLLSALVFASFGRILYELKFYYILYMIMVVFLRVKKAAYEEFKKLLWHLMMAFVGFVVVPWIIDVLNKVISFFYNIWVFVLYVLPPVAVLICVFLIAVYVFKNRAVKGEVVAGGEGSTA